MLITSFFFPSGSAYYYVSYRAEDDRYVEQIYTNVPSELNKKVSLLQKFGMYEEKELKHDQPIPKTKQLNKIYLLKYYVSEEAITFRLSNGAVQVKSLYHEHRTPLIDILQNSSTFSNTSN